MNIESTLPTCATWTESRPAQSRTSTAASASQRRSRIVQYMSRTARCFPLPQSISMHVSIYMYAESMHARETEPNSSQQSKKPRPCGEPKADKLVSRSTNLSHSAQQRPPTLCIAVARSAIALILAPHRERATRMLSLAWFPPLARRVPRTAARHRPSHPPLIEPPRCLLRL